MKVNEMYVAPALEVINVAVEKGFAGSSDSGDVEVNETPVG